MGNRKLPADYEALARERGIQWLGPTVDNTKTKTKWQCDQGHTWSAPYSSIYRGRTCPHCRGRQPKVAADYHTLAAGRGFHWLGPEVPNVNTRTGWMCADGHRWRTTYSAIRHGNGCPACAGVLPKTPADYHTLAQERGLRWLGPEVANTMTKTGWECTQGHEWQASYSQIGQGRGCPVCANTLRKTPADYHALAQARGFRWVGPEVKAVRYKTTWKCDQGHEWSATYSNIRNGSGCPQCADFSPRTSEDYHTLAARRDFRWLGPAVANTFSSTTWECSQGHRWQNSYRKINRGAVCPDCATLANKNRKRRSDPADYHALAEQRGFRWLGPMVTTASAKTKWGCAQAHQWEASYNRIQQGGGCPFCAGLAPKQAADYHALAASRGFEWLGPEAATTSDNTEWACEAGHRWQSAYVTVLRGGGCPVCKKALPKTPADYHQLAQSRGFDWLGPPVTTVGAITNWQCEQGHRWATAYKSIRDGTGCPVCAGVTSAAPSKLYERLAQNQKVGLAWLGPPVAHTHLLTAWQCRQGHVWQATYNQIQRGGTCPLCAGETVAGGPGPPTS